MRRFYLDRQKDATGVSGVGIVCEGVQFTDGTCAMRWLTGTASTSIWDNIYDLVEVHGHNGQTVVAWLDPIELFDERRPKP